MTNAAATPSSASYCYSANSTTPTRKAQVVLLRDGESILMDRDEYQSIKETAEIMADDAFMEAINGPADPVISLDEVRSRLGL